MKPSLSFISNYRWHLVAILIFIAGLVWYNQTKTSDTTAATSFYAVSTVETGEVTSGIQTTGEIIAAQKLDIDVYKQLSRINEVNVANGSHVETGTVLFSFDKSDAYVAAGSAQVAVAEAALKLETEKESVVDPNTAINTKTNQIASFEKTIADTKTDLADAYLDFLNTDLEAVPSKDKYSTLSSRVYPTISGRYLNNATGIYTVEVYSSGADSGFSYRVSGLESYTDNVIFGKVQDLGLRGLKITFPSTSRSGDKWLVHVPNDQIVAYTENKSDYEEAVADLNKIITDATVNLNNARQELEELKRTDSTNYRNLAVEQAAASLSEARQRLSQNYDVVQEMDIVAPFSGTVEGMENVVVGATPTGGESDTISLGTLISDEFLTTFSLSASDIAKVSVGQRVKVTITSFTDQPVFEATITEISSLPESSGVAKYEVRAKLDYDRESAEMILREGMLADIEIVQKQKGSAIRVPTSAITYTQGKPYVTIIENLNEEQKAQVARMGVVRSDSGPLNTYQTEVTVGIVGQYYIEITSGLSEGNLVVTTTTSDSSSNESVVGQAGFGPGRNSGTAAQPPANPSE